MKRFTALILCTMLVTACTREREVHLYPVTASRDNGGMLTATVISHGTGHGEFKLPMPDGEILKGEYTIVRNGQIAFGGIYASVYGRRGFASAYGTSTSYSIEGASPGTSDAVGPKGTTSQCEFYNDNSSGHGYGACRISKGKASKTYRLQY